MTLYYKNPADKFDTQGFPIKYVNNSQTFAYIAEKILYTYIS